MSKRMYEKHNRHVLAMLHDLTMWKRIFSRKGRRHVLCMIAGGVVMLAASTMATTHQNFVPHNVWDAVAYFTHGIGAIPILTHIEPLWMLIVAEV